jgi:3-dehydroquinate dehydratase
MERAEKLKQ